MTRRPFVLRRIQPCPVRLVATLAPTVDYSPSDDAIDARRRAGAGRETPAGRVPHGPPLQISDSPPPTWIETAFVLA